MIRALFSIYGRVGRSTWWLGQLCCICLCVFATALLIGSPAGAHLIAALAMLAFLWINVSVTIKRYHDLGKSGAWFVIVFVPLIGPVWQIVECGFVMGELEHNAYGPPPGFGSAGNDEDAATGALASKEIDFAKYRLSEPVIIQSSGARQTAAAMTQKPVFGKRI